MLLADNSQWLCFKHFESGLPNCLNYLPGHLGSPHSRYGKNSNWRGNIKIPSLPRALFTHLSSLQVCQYCTEVYFWHTFACHFNTNLYKQSLKESDCFIVIFLLVFKGYDCINWEMAQWESRFLAHCSSSATDI